MPTDPQPRGNIARLFTGVDWIDNPPPMKHESRNLTDSVEGEDRDATWKEGVGIYMDEFDIGRGDTLLIEATPHEVTEMRRMQLEGGAVTLIVKAVQREGM